MAGQRIDDHSYWAGKGSDGAVLAQGAKSKMLGSAEGAGELSRYEDTSEAIKSAQMAGRGKIKGHAPKAEYRN